MTWQLCKTCGDAVTFRRSPPPGFFGRCAPCAELLAYLEAPADWRTTTGAIAPATEAARVAARLVKFERAGGFVTEVTE